MSDVKAVRYLLANNAALVAVVPATRIEAGLIPQGTALPALAVTHVSNPRGQLIAGPASCVARVQVTVHASSYPQQKQVLTLVRAALPRTHGTVNGVKVESLVVDLEGPDFRNDEVEPSIFMGSQDFIVTYNE
jgi:hypothetical protein